LEEVGEPGRACLFVAAAVSDLREFRIAEEYHVGDVVMVFRYIPFEEFQDACKRIDPGVSHQSLDRKVKRLLDQGYTLAIAIVQVADDLSISRKPPGSVSSAKAKKRTEKARA
jgi:hypothetical protein